MSRIRSFVGLAAAVLFVASGSLAQAQGVAYQGYWALSGVPGSWSNAANWNSTDNNGVATTGVPWYIATIDNGGTATIGSADGTVTCPNVTIGDATGSGYLNLSAGGSLGPSTDFNLYELVGSGNSGIVAQTGGINCPYTPYSDGLYNSLSLGTVNGAYGEYDMSGGALAVNAVFLGAPDVNPGFGSLGGTGVFKQTGGSLGAFGSGSGSNQPVALMIGGNWAGNPGGGSGSGNKTVTDVGSYTLSDSAGPGGAPTGTLLVGGCEIVGVDGTGTFNQSGGTNAIVGGGMNAGHPGLSMVSLGDGNFDDAYGALLLGYFTNFGKTGSGSSANKYAGNGKGTYTLSGGLLTGGNSDSGGMEIIGVGGTGIFNQTGGTNYTSVSVYVGGNDNAIFAVPKGGQGWYTLSNGLLNCGSLYLGESGTAIFTQTGGTNINAAITIGGQSSIKAGYNDTQGTYNLNGGLLQTSAIQAGSRDDGTITGIIFNFTAGTIQALSTGYNPGLNNSMPITVGTAANNVATIDANGQTVWLNSNYQGYALAGPGNLTLLSSVSGGKFVLGGNDTSFNPIANTYQGATTVLSGTLQVVSSTALPSTTVLTVGGAGAATFDLNGQQVSIQGLVTASNLAVINFATPGTDLLTILPGGTVSINPGTEITLGTTPAATPGVFYDLIAGDPNSASDLADFSLVAASGFHLALDPANGDIALAAVPEPGTFALLGVGLLSLLGFAWRRKKLTVVS